MHKVPAVAAGGAKASSYTDPCLRQQNKSMLFLSVPRNPKAFAIYMWKEVCLKDYRRLTRRPPVPAVRRVHIEIPMLFSDRFFGGNSDNGEWRRDCGCKFVACANGGGPLKIKKSGRVSFAGYVK